MKKRENIKKGGTVVKKTETVGNETLKIIRANCKRLRKKLKAV